MWSKCNAITVIKLQKYSAINPSKHLLIYCYTTLCRYKTITTELMAQPDVRTLLEAESTIKFNSQPQKLRTKDLAIVGSNTLKLCSSNLKH